MIDDKLFIALAIQLPFIAAFIVAQQRGWIVLGRSHDREIEEKDKRLAAKDAELLFREQLRQEGLRRAEGLEARVEKFATALSEATEVMERSIAFNEQLVEREDKREARHQT